MRKTQILNSLIERDIRLPSRMVHVVTSEVRIKSGVTITIEDGAEILICNGPIQSSKLRRAALIFEAGSALKAKRVFVRGCNELFRPTKSADNGGIWFLGNFKSGNKDGIRVSARLDRTQSNFKADLIATYYLGRADPLKASKNTKQDDIDGLSIIGVGPLEWNIAELRSYHSADDGIDITNSEISLERLRIMTPSEDGINLSSSRLSVKRSLYVNVGKTKIQDRDIFDFESDDGPSYLELAQHCHVNFNGFFGDQLMATSDDLVGISKRRGVVVVKQYLRKSPALIYTLNQD
jgi:hypothetical protein